MKKLYNLIPVHCLGDLIYKGLVIKDDKEIYIYSDQWGKMSLKTRNRKKIKSYWKKWIEQETGFPIQYIRIEKIKDHD